MLVLLVAACTGPQDTDPDSDEPVDPHSTPIPSTGGTGSTGSTGDTATPGTTGTFDCVNLPVGPFLVDEYPIETTEDFDFDALGMLVYSDWVNFMAVDSYGVRTVVAPGIEDTRGIQILSDGNIAANYISQGRIGYTDRLTGAGVTWVSGLAGPNALEVGDGDILYFTETGSQPKVSSFDPATGEVEELAGGFDYPNGLALSPDQQRLYIGDSGALSTNGLGFYMIEKDTAGEWGPKVLLVNPPGPYDGIETDICGNVYAVNFSNGELNRFDPDTLDSELLIDLDDSAEFLWNSIRWGSDRGIWKRDVIYVTDRNKVFGVHVGVPGRNQPVDLMP